MWDRPCATGWLLALAPLLLAGCDNSGTLAVQPDVWPPADDDDLLDDDDTGEPDDDDTGDDDDDIADDDDDDDSGPFFDCDTVPTSAGVETIIPGARGYHGLAIDDQDRIVGSDGWSLIRSDYEGDWSVWMPSVGAVEQMTYMDNGDLIYASVDTGGIHRITPDGGQSQIASGLNAYGVTIGPDGMIWTAGWNGTIDRIDPETGQVVQLGTIYNNSPHAIGFNLDYSVLYIGTVGDGRLYKMELDENLDPVGGPLPWVNVGGGWQDAIAVDICGYVYVPDYWSTTLWRIHPTTGVVSVYADWNNNSSWYGHGAIWGTGSGGWRHDAVYVPMPYGGDQVREVVIGVPGRDWEGTALNLP